MLLWHVDMKIGLEILEELIIARGLPLERTSIVENSIYSHTHRMSFVFFFISRNFVNMHMLREIDSVNMLIVQKVIELYVVIWQRSDNILPLSFVPSLSRRKEKKNQLYKSVVFVTVDASECFPHWPPQTYLSNFIYSAFSVQKQIYSNGIVIHCMPSNQILKWLVLSGCLCMCVANSTIIQIFSF